MFLYRLIPRRTEERMPTNLHHPTQEIESNKQEQRRRLHNRRI